MSSYRDSVKLKQERQPSLEILLNFLDSPNTAFVVPIDGSEPSIPIDVKVVAIGTGDSPWHCKTESDLKQYINEAKKDEKRSGTIIIAEDLSPAVINILGEEFAIEPEFFASHLEGTEQFRKVPFQEPISQAPRVLPSCYRTAPFYSLNFRRPFAFFGDRSKLIAWRSSRSNTPRGILVTSGSEGEAILPNSFALERVSVYKKNSSKIGIIVTDRLVSKQLPQPHALDAVASLSDDLPKWRKRLSHVSCRDELIEWLKLLSTEEERSLFSEESEPLALRPILKIAEKTSTTFLTILRYYSSRINNRQCNNDFPDNIDFALGVARCLHRHNYNQQEMLTRNIAIARAKGCGNLEEVQDIKDLIEEMKLALCALQEDVQFIISASSVKHAKQVTWFTKFATLVVPINTVAAILAIAGSGDESTNFKIFGGITIPVLLITSYFIFYWRAEHVHRLGLVEPGQLFNPRDLWDLFPFGH